MNLVVNRPLVGRGVAFGAGKGADRNHFCVPWQDGTIIGTWYWRAPNANTTCIDAHQLIELGGLLLDVNDSLIGAEIKDSDITRIHSGRLPGSRTHSGDAEDSLLKDTLVMRGAQRTSSPGYVVVEGTKFISANVVAAEVMECCRSWDEDEVDRQIQRILEQPYDGRWIEL